MSKIVVPPHPMNLPPLLCPELTPVLESYRNPWFKVMDRGTYYTLEYDRPQVVILPVVDDGPVVMVRVKRPVINDDPWELPAGDSAAGETLQEAARRELAEETGISIDDLNRFVPVKPISEMPGRIPVLLSVFRINLTRQEYLLRSFPDHEISAVELFSKWDIVKKIVSGEIYLSSPMAILSRYIFEGPNLEDIV